MIRAEIKDNGVEVRIEGEMKNVFKEFHYLANSIAGGIAKHCRYTTEKVLNIMANSLKSLADSYSSTVKGNSGGGFKQ